MSIMLVDLKSLVGVVVQLLGEGSKFFASSLYLGEFSIEARIERERFNGNIFIFY